MPSLVLKENLIHVVTETKMFVFDATAIEDEDAVLESRGEFYLDGAYDVIEFNKFLVASKLNNTITFYNFWK